MLSKQFPLFYVHFLARKWQFCTRKVVGAHNVLIRSVTDCYQGIKKQGKGLQDFYADIALSVAILYFRTLVCVTTLVYYTAYLPPLALFPCRGVSRRTDKRTVCNRSFDRASWTTSLKTSLSDGPGCWDPEAQLLLSSSRRSETCGTEETGINEVSLSGACCYCSTKTIRDRLELYSIRSWKISTKSLY